jgi:hypothetical protein
MLFKNMILPALVAGSFIYAHNAASQATQIGTSSSIIIHFSSAPATYKLSKSPLKYNKDFAYSFTLDDGKIDAYTVAYPLFRGGTVNNKSYSGLFYTDGCGNKIPFKGGLAMTSVNALGEDTHIDNEENLRWVQIAEMHTSGWNVFNHSYSHASGVGTNYTHQVTANRSHIKSKTGIDPTHFVIPSGDINYIGPAYSNGMKAIYNENDFPGNDGFKVDGPITLNQFKLYRRFLDDSRYTTATIKDKIDFIASQSVNGNHYWFSEFTHHVSPQPKGGSLIFSTFEYYMNYIHTTYGQPGSDRVWMAPLQEVYEYLAVRENVSVGEFKNLNTVEAMIDFSKVPSDLEKYALTILVESDQDIMKVEGFGVSVVSFKGAGAKKLINLEWNRHPNTVTAIEDAQQIKVAQCPLSVVEINPNPVHNTIVLNLMSDKEDEITIYLIDNSGKEILLGNKRIQLYENNIEINIQEFQLAPGSYYIKLVSEEDKCETSKVVVKH